VLEVDGIPGESLSKLRLTMLSLLDLAERSKGERRSALRRDRTFTREKVRWKDATYLDLGLLSRRLIEISSLDPISSLLPKPPRLPLSLSLDRRDRHLLLLNRGVREELSGLQLGGLCRKAKREDVIRSCRRREARERSRGRTLTVPLSINGEDVPSRRVRHVSLEGVSLSRDVSSSRVAKGRDVSSRTVDVGSFGNFHVRRT